MTNNFAAKKIFFIGFLGNVAEWYDFSIYAYFALIIGQNFFDVQSPTSALIKAFFVFSISYLARPFGSIFFGYLGDKLGRAAVLRFSLLIMAIPTLLIGLLPTYKTLGVTSSYLLVLFRLLQGFAAGGELPVSSCYVYEISPKYKKNFFCSFVTASSMFGVLLASIVAMLLSTICSKNFMLLWGWRIPFLIGFIVFFFILWIRRSIVNVVDVDDTSVIKNGWWQDLKKHKRAILYILCLYAFIQTVFYLVFVWLPSFLQIFLNIDKGVSLIANCLSLAVLIALTLFFGFMADYFNPKKLIIFSVLSIGILAYPLFYLITSGNVFYIFVAQIIFAVCLSAIDGVMIATMGKLFKKSIRCFSIGISSTIASSIFGGLSPTLCSYLVEKTNYLMCPALMLVVVSFIALFAIFKFNLTESIENKFI